MSTTLMGLLALGSIVAYKRPRLLIAAIALAIGVVVLLKRRSHRSNT